ncbi:hypothetical protein B1A99_04350 [Cohnella sp. CIP 111063]|uniref:carbohydrate ABC transporter permease n=1 Tax=unclassified Cohnella TaxID=2636738 RepID=UPI000B8BD436|nr:MULTISPECIES: carbohydrate ABC transporter permease [unclassified Cohnella]OXS61844.1 hypothetical protein B1A99_04350 [Cohnella sp. CIP 111063]PRX74288.1 raffinose/stachyose/melibiose transport system permease protein [Cohnella sp. SGD-V74]
MGQLRKPPLLIEALMLLLALLFLLPVCYLLMMSIKQPAIFYDPFKLPNQLYLEYYKAAFQDVAFFRGLGNTLYVTLGGLVLTILVASMSGFVLARMNQRFFRYVFLFILSGLIIPTVGSLIPMFKLAIALELINTRTLLVFMAAAAGIPMATFLYSAFTKSIPRELEESAAIDGCGRLRLFWMIIFPLLMPATGTFVITNIYAAWNDFVTPLIFLNDPSKMTLMPQIVQFMANKQSINLGPVFALSVLSVLPLVVLFLFTQKYMLKGLVMGSVKG